jgi:hypothetical protein
MFTYWEWHNPGFENLAAYLPGSSMNLNGGEKPAVVAATRSSRNYFRLFGANPILGRTLTAEEDQPAREIILTAIAFHSAAIEIERQRRKCRISRFQREKRVVVCAHRARAVTSRPHNQQG